ncbi:hypothetical protein V1514DRAFT_183383 [Lipomyces japonicus]|uniref:uncharacterized protein n=1 Tax=Lipomyces japonicus TaxID=56871 RepID=UPI0034D02154
MVSQVELNAIRQDYIVSLEELSFNSRPIITNLTIIAQENIQAAEVITRAIEEHISKCSPSAKLPALYLLDSICKNIGSPYTLLFGRNLYRTFTDAYTLVNDPIRRKMHELFHTWKQPTASGQNLFSSEPIRRIDNYLQKARAAFNDVAARNSPVPVTYSNSSLQRPHVPTPPGQHAIPYSLPDRQSVPLQPTISGNGNGIGGSDYSSYANNNIDSLRYANDLPQPTSRGFVSNVGAPLTSAGLISEISDLIHLTSLKLRENPLDVECQTQHEALSQLNAILLTSSLPQFQLQAIQERLQVLSSELRRGSKRKADDGQIPAVTSPAPKRAWNEPSISSIGSSQQLPQLPQTWMSSKPSISTFHSSSLPSSGVPVIQPDLLTSVAQALAQSQDSQSPTTLPFQQSQFNSQPAVPNVGAVVPDASSLFASLMSAGLISGSSAPAPPKPPSVAMTILNSTANQIILSSNITLSTKFLQQHRSDLSALLYDSLPLQCSTCGRRFADTERDRKIRDAHLDWHFRVNKKLRDDVRGQSRSWYLDQDAWIKHTDVDVVDIEFDGSDGSGFGSGGANGQDGSGQKEDVSNRYILVSTDGAILNAPCPICKEKFKSVWHDKAEDWVWMNAQEGPNSKIYHATCLQDAGGTA